MYVNRFHAVRLSAIAIPADMRMQAAMRRGSFIDAEKGVTHVVQMDSVSGIDHEEGSRTATASRMRPEDGSGIGKRERRRRPGSEKE